MRLIVKGKSQIFLKKGLVRYVMHTNINAVHAHSCLYCLLYWLLLSSCTLYNYNDYYLYNLIIDIRATELHNENEEAKRDDKVEVGTCEVSESGSKILGKTGCVVHVCHVCSLHISVTCHSKLAWLGN